MTEQAPELLIEVNCHLPDIARLIKGIKDAPTVDAAPPIVRCCNCKYARMTYSGKCKYCQLDIDRGDLRRQCIVMATGFTRTVKGKANETDCPIKVMPPR